MLGYKASLDKFKKIEIISNIFSYKNAMRLEVNYKGKNYKKWKYMEGNQYATKQPMDHWKKIKEEIKKYLETNENESTMIQNRWDAAKAVLRRKFIAIQSYLK